MTDSLPCLRPPAGVNAPAPVASDLCEMLTAATFSLQAHWDYPETLVFDGGHVGIGMARDVPGFVAGALSKSGLVGPGQQPGPTTR